MATTHLHVSPIVVNYNGLIVFNFSSIFSLPYLHLKAIVLADILDIKDMLVFTSCNLQQYNTVLFVCGSCE